MSDEARRDRERALRGASSGEERAAARLRVAAEERRRGQLDLAALAVAEALREGAERDDAGSELAAILAADVSEPGAHRALRCFAASPPIEPRVALFRATVRALPGDRTAGLARSVAAVTGGSKVKAPPGEWGAFLGRSVSVAEADALSELYGRLLAAERRRVTALLDTPGPIHELSSHKLGVDGDGFELSFAGDEQLYSLRRSEGKLLLQRNRIIGLQPIVDEAEVFAGLDVTAPRLVGSAGGAFVAGVDADGLLHASLSAGGGELVASKKRIGRGVSIAAACDHARGLAVFLDSGGRAVIFGRDGRFTREKKLPPGREVVSAASHGAEAVVLLRAPSGCELVRLDADLRPLGEPAAVPYLRSPRDARVAWITPDLLLVIEPPDVAHAFGADDRKHAWTARLSEPLHDLEPAVSEALELIAYGPIEGELGEPEGDLGLARWTRDGLGRHGPTVRLETEPGVELGRVRLATRGNLLAIAYREGDRLVQRLLVLVQMAAASPAPAEWTFANDEAAPPQPPPLRGGDLGGARL